MIRVNYTTIGFRHINFYYIYYIYKMKEVFTAIADQENGIFKATDKKYVGQRGSAVFVSYYHLNIPYKENRIIINYELGNYNIAKIEMELQPGITIPEISITNRSHYYRLFYRKSNILKVEALISLLKNTLKIYCFQQI